MVSAIIASSSPTWPNAYAQLRPYSRKEPRSSLFPRWKRPFAPYSQNSQLYQYFSSSIGTLSSTSLDNSMCIAMPATMVSEQRSNRNSLTALSTPWSILIEKLSRVNGTGLPWNSKPDASYGVLVAFAANYSACSSRFTRIMSVVSNKSAK